MATKRKTNLDLSKKDTNKDVKTDSKKESKRKIMKFQIIKRRDIGHHFWSAANKHKMLTTKYVEENSPKELNPTLRRIRLFDHRQTLFKDYFRKSSIFKSNCKNPYKKIDSLYNVLKTLEKEEEFLLRKLNLQTLYFPENLPLKIVQREIKQAKIMWDYINVVKTNLKQLKKTEWDESTVEEVEMQLRNFKTELKTLEDIKGCDAYVQLMLNISQVLNCIYTVMELNNRALGDSLWKEMILQVKEQEKEIKNTDQRNDKETQKQNKINSKSELVKEKREKPHKKEIKIKK